MMRSALPSCSAARPARRPTLLAVLALGLAALPAPPLHAQTVAPRPGDRPAVATTVPQAPAPPRRLSLFASVANAFDTNVEHDDTGVRAYGLVLGGGLQFRDDPVDPAFSFVYEAGLHRYQGTDNWNRVSQLFRADAEQDLVGPFKLELIGEVSLKGTSEDRELSDQYMVQPKLALRLDSRRRLRWYGAYRIRRYESDPARDATNRYLGAEFLQRGDRGERWTLDVRYERNDARGLRNVYDRFTYSTEIETPMGRRDRLGLEIKYRLQRYPNRFVEIEDVDVTRRDHRWIPTVSWRRAITEATELRVAYVLEMRASNDPTRDFDATLLSVGIRRRW